MRQKAARLRRVLWVAALGLTLRIFGAAQADVPPPEPRGGFGRYQKLLDAAEADDVATVKLLLGQRTGATVCWHESFEPVLYRAARFGSMRVLEYLLSARPELAKFACTETRWASSAFHAVLESDPAQGTPKTPLTREQRLRIVRLLIKAGAPLDFRDSQGVTPLHIAARRGDLELVKMFLDAGANVSIQVSGIMHHVHPRLDKNGKSLDPEGKTALELAEEHGHAAVAAEIRKRPPGRPTPAASEIPNF